MTTTNRKGRRLNQPASVLAHTAATAASPVAVAPARSSRPLHQQTQSHAASPIPAPRKRDRAPVAVEVYEAEDDEEDIPPDEEDNNPYCYCHQPSHGEVRHRFLPLFFNKNRERGGN